MRQSRAQVLLRAGPLITGDFLRWVALAVLAIAGMGVAAYLTYSHYADQPIACAGLSGCEAVQNSEYSEMAGIPVALLGVLFCAGLLGLVLGRAARLPLTGEWGSLVAFSMTSVGVAFAAYLTYIELFVVEDICIWCTSFAGIVAVAWLIALVDVLAPINE
ncbi:MAG: vitamin K epoxide reductase family protein [Dehalococcoidia bacterium]